MRFFFVCFFACLFVCLCFVCLFFFCLFVFIIWFFSFLFVCLSASSHFSQLHRLFFVLVTHQLLISSAAVHGERWRNNFCQGSIIFNQTIPNVFVGQKNSLKSIFSLSCHTPTAHLICSCSQRWGNIRLLRFSVSESWCTLNVYSPV